MDKRIKIVLIPLVIALVVGIVGLIINKTTLKPDEALDKRISLIETCDKESNEFRETCIKEVCESIKGSFDCKTVFSTEGIGIAYILDGKVIIENIAGEKQLISEGITGRATKLNYVLYDNDSKVILLSVLTESGNVFISGVKDLKKGSDKEFKSKLNNFTLVDGSGGATDIESRSEPIFDNEDKNRLVIKINDEWHFVNPVWEKSESGNEYIINAQTGDKWNSVFSYKELYYTYYESSSNRYEIKIEHNNSLSISRVTKIEGKETSTPFKSIISSGIILRAKLLFIDDKDNIYIVSNNKLYKSDLNSLSFNNNINVAFYRDLKSYVINDLGEIELTYTDNTKDTILTDRDIKELN